MEGPRTDENTQRCNPRWESEGHRPSARGSSQCPPLCLESVQRAVEVHAPGPCVRPEETGQFVRLSSLRLHLMYLFASVLTRPRLKFSLTAWLPPEVISVILLYGRPLSRRLSGRDAL